jgi:hypothetical protein
MIKIKVNRIIKYLILSDLAFWSGWGLITPVFAIFIVQRIEGGSALIAGMASAIYWILKSVLRLPVSVFLDKCFGEKDDYWFLTVGLLIASFVPFGFIFATEPIHIYILQCVHAFGIAISVAGWSPIFTRHLDRGQEATQWGLSDSSFGIGTGITSLVGGWAVMNFGFNPVFIAVGVMGLMGVFFLLCLRNDIKGVFDRGLRMDLKDIFDGEEDESTNL